MDPAPPTKAAAILSIAAALAGCAAEAPRSDEIFAVLEQGQTREEVRALVGPPDETMKFPMLRSEAWDYRYQDTWGYMAVFSVTFGPDGRAQSKISRRINDGGNHGQ